MMQHVKKTATCWLWQRACTKKGYGVLWHNKKLRAAHRLSWELAYGPIPSGMMVLHRCDVRNCVRPSHLFIGTATMNTADMMRKERDRCVRNRNPSAKLSTVDVDKIKQLYLTSGKTQREIAKAFNVHQSTISIVTRLDERGMLQPREPK